MSNIGSYDDVVKTFTWEKAKEMLGYKDGDTLNIGWYCSDRICNLGRAEHTALIWEGHGGEVRNYTYNDLRKITNTYADYLKKLGIKEGERVAIFMDKIPDLYFSFLGILKLGAIVQPLFSAFGEDSLLTRMESAETCAIITTKKHFRKVRRARKDLPSLRNIIIVDDEEIALEQGESIFILDKNEWQESFDCAKTTPESPSVLHYTSGTTGKPKGALHVHNSLLAQYASSRFVLDLKDDDIYWCTADPGWVTGTSYGIIGPWSCGVTQVVFDGGFSTAKWYEILQNYNVTVWYTAPTAIRLLMKDGRSL
jgi:acetyl-CoA synthetase